MTSSGPSEAPPGSLARLLGSPVPVARAVAIAGSLCDVLTAQGRAGRYAGSLEPLGIALAADERVTSVSPPASGAVTDAAAPYTAPEVAQQAAAGPAADVYSVAALLYHLLCGRPPFPAASAQAVLVRQALEAVRPLRQPGVPASIEAVVLRALSKDPAARPADPAQLQHELAAALAGAASMLPGGPPAPPAASMSGTLAPARPARAARLWPFAVLAGVLLIAVAGGGLLLRRQHEAPALAPAPARSEAPPRHAAAQQAPPPAEQEAQTSPEEVPPAPDSAPKPAKESRPTRAKPSPPAKAALSMRGHSHGARGAARGSSSEDGLDLFGGDAGFSPAAGGTADGGLERGAAPTPAPTRKRIKKAKPHRQAAPPAEDLHGGKGSAPGAAASAEPTTGAPPPPPAPEAPPSERQKPQDAIPGAVPAQAARPTRLVLWGLCLLALLAAVSLGAAVYLLRRLRQAEAAQQRARSQAIPRLAAPDDRTLLSPTLDGPTAQDAGPTLTGPSLSAHGGGDEPGELDPFMVGPYRCFARLGEGGMGMVYKAEHVALSRVSAVKVLLPQAAFHSDTVERFRREARLASSINHPNSVFIYDYGEAGSHLFYLAMEFIAGASLADILQPKGQPSVPLPLQRVLHITRQICGALEAAHQAGIVHRDLKPQNVMVCQRAAEHDYVKVVDFGIARSLDAPSAHQTLTGAVLGTPAYMSPEQANGASDVDARSDIFSLALMVYRMLAGDLPFRKEGMTPLQQVIARALLREPPPPIRQLRPDLGIPVGIESALRRALTPDRLERTPTAAQFLRELEAA